MAQSARVATNAKTFFIHPPKISSGRLVGIRLPGAGPLVETETIAVDDEYEIKHHVLWLVKNTNRPAGRGAKTCVSQTHFAETVFPRCVEKSESAAGVDARTAFWAARGAAGTRFRRGFG